MSLLGTSATIVAQLDFARLSIGNNIDEHHIRHAKFLNEQIQHLSKLLQIFSAQSLGEPSRFEEPADTAIVPLSFANIKVTVKHSYVAISTQRELKVSPDTPDIITDLWFGISSLFCESRRKFYLDKQHTRDIVKDGQYVGLLYMFMPLIREWKSSLDEAPSKPIVIELGPAYTDPEQSKRA